MSHDYSVKVRPLAVAAVLAIVAGVGAIALAWYHMGNTNQVWIQNQELASGGLLGVGLIIIGSALLIRDGIVRAAELRGAESSSPPASADPATNGHGTRRRSSVKETV